MRIILSGLIIAIGAVLTTAAAQTRPARPTGFEIKGCTYYELRDKRMVRICDPRSTRDPVLFWKLRDREGGGSGGSE